MVEPPIQPLTQLTSLQESQGDGMSICDGLPVHCKPTRCMINNNYHINVNINFTFKLLQYQDFEAMRLTRIIQCSTNNDKGDEAYKTPNPIFRVHHSKSTIVINQIVQDENYYLLLNILS